MSTDTAFAAPLTANPAPSPAGNTRLDPAQVLQRVRSLPTLPAIVLALEQAVRDDAAPVARILGLIGSDAALTATALRLANSSFFRVSGRVVSLRDAVQILGLRAVSSAVTTAAVMNSFGPTACPGFDARSHWRHSLAVALGAQRLAERRGIDPCTAYTSGLLHDLGTLALAVFFPQAWAATRAPGTTGTAGHGLPLEAERQRLGIDHAQVGGMVARHWRLAPAVAEAIALHHEPPPGGSPLPDVVHLADNIAHALDLDSGSGDELVPPLAPGVWERLVPGADELQQLFAHIESRVERDEPVGGAEGDPCGEPSKARGRRH
jgi:putative nucleotidyltransferase with HDIG domain